MKKTTKQTIGGIDFNVVVPIKQAKTTAEVKFGEEVYEVEIPKDFWEKHYKSTVEVYNEGNDFKTSTTKKLVFAIGDKHPSLSFAVTYDHENHEIVSIIANNDIDLMETYTKKELKIFTKELKAEFENFESEKSWFYGVGECESCSEHFISVTNHGIYKNCSGCETSEGFCEDCGDECDYDYSAKEFKQFCPMHQALEDGNGKCEQCGEEMDSDDWDGYSFNDTCISCQEEEEEEN